MHEAQKVGFSAEMLVASKLCEAGNVISIPLVQTAYDLLADDEQRLWKIQVKKAWFVPQRTKKAGLGEREHYMVNLASHMGHATRRRWKRADLTKFDYLAVVCTADLIYLIPSSELGPDGVALKTLRIKPTELIQPVRKDSIAACNRFEPWKNNFRLRPQEPVQNFSVDSSSEAE